ncbi:MAG: glycosyl hydrolase family 57 [Bdellovibrionota bacterium]
MTQIPEYQFDLPTISGYEKEVEEVILQNKDRNFYLESSPYDFSKIRGVASIALHCHQPLIPAGGGDNLETASFISNLKYMMDNQGIGDNHNAPVFLWCYKRIGEFIPELSAEGKEPRCMLEYTGELLYGLRNMGAHDVIDSLKSITCDSRYNRYIEWLGCPWGHAVAPSTPMQDFKLHVKAWQQYFASIFGLEALARVRGFSPSEMALPNHPDTAYEYVKVLKECGFKWLLVQEHTIELLNGEGVKLKHIPHRLVCKNSDGKEESIVVLIKTQGSDTKLVAQMQPFYEAQSFERLDFARKNIPMCATQIADGENGGVMMNEFPPKFKEVSRQLTRDSDVVLMNGSEYLEHFFNTGIKEEDLPAVQPMHQKKLWDNFNVGDGREKLESVISEISRHDHLFNMEGGSWTNDISWVRGYENVLGPMEKVSVLFNEKIINNNIPTRDERFANALFLLMCSQTSCFRYWGQGTWTDYAREICRRGEAYLNGI